MPSPDQQSPANRGIDWPAVVRILLVQVLVLLAVAGAFIAYVNWSSERAFTEFVRASEVSVPAPPQPQSWAWIRAVKGQASCKR